MHNDIPPESLRHAVTSEMRQQMTSYVLKVDQILEDMRMLKWTVYGNETAGELGLVKSVRSIQTKLDTILELSQARENQWKGIKAALIAIGAITSIPALQVLLPIVGKAIGALSGNP